MTNAERPPYLLAVATSLVVLVIYLLTLAPTTAFWDTSEYIAAAKVLGIPHPPGNPLFVLMAHVFGLLPVAGSYAERINLFAAVTSAAGAGFWFLVSDRWLRALVPTPTARRVAAFTGVLVGATLWTVWNQSTVNEKVYTVSMFSIALVTWLAVHWGDDEPGSHRDRWLILIAYLLALTSTNHMMGVLAAPAVIVYVLWTDWRVLTRPAVLAGIVLAVVIGLTPNYLFLPIRAAQFPAINEGEPVGFFSKALMDVLNRVQYGKPSVFTSPVDGTPRSASFFASQLANYWQYVSWQFARDWGRVGQVATGLFTALGLFGLVQLIRRDRRAGIAAAAMTFTLTLALIFYLNFRYGYSMYPERTDLISEMREVRERDYFFVCGFAFFGTLIAAGVGAAMTAVVDALRPRQGERAWLAAYPIALVGLIPLLGNRVTASRDHEFAARDFARDLLESVEPYSILITAGDNDTFPLWYAQEVEGIRRDVTIANMSLMNTEWHLKQIRRRETPEFDPGASLPLWRPGPDSAGLALGDSTTAPGRWIRPSGPLLDLSESELDSLPEFARAPTNPVPIGNVVLRFGTNYLDRKDLATIFLIRDNLGKRPIYFAWSAGGFPDATLGLTEYLVSQGFARKLYPRKVVPGGPIIQSAGMGFMDIERTKELLFKGYLWKSAARDRPRGWVDDPSRSILDLYAVIYGGVAETLRQQGDSALAARADSVATAVARSLRPREASRDN
jgi:hypothetical protein